MNCGYSESIDLRRLTAMSKNPFNDLMQQINKVAGNVQRDRGTLFERLVLSYLKNEPTYKNLYKNVWMLNNVPDEYGIPKKDNGVDLAAQQFNGDLVAVQAKFYKDKVSKNDIDSFVAELGKTYYQHGLIVSTVDVWGKNAKDTIVNNEKGIEIIGLSDLRNSQIDWTQYSFERSESVEIKAPKKLRSYQATALDLAVKHYEKYDRGQLIMAPGTGKTFTSLKIAEALAKKQSKQFFVLYLVPSIQLLTQTLRSWNNDRELKFESMAVTSDRDASRGSDGTEDIKASDIGYPATTSAEQLLKNWNDFNSYHKAAKMLVIFSTYQSIDVLGNAQKNGFPDFDFIVADEAHRTTNAHSSNKEDSVFAKVHSNDNVRGKKRMYQTATPKIYGDKAKKDAKDKSILISSMDDPDKYGEVFYRMGFGQAVSHGILTDYKVMVLAVDEAAIVKDMQRTLSDEENGLNIDDVGRIVGIWNGMMRRNGYKNPIKNSPYDGAPLERAIAFTRTIADSKKVSQQFEEVVNDYIGGAMENQPVHLAMRHADGSMNALQKGEVLDWLSDSDKPDDEARIVSNVRFLTEGIDVPTLDAVIFLAPKKSQVDIVQAVGRIMRKAEGKDYGYIILPVVIPTDETPETVLDNNKNYEAVWQVINALRSVDERFEAMVDKINIAKPKQLKVIGIGSAPDKGNDLDDTNGTDKENSVQTELNLEWDKFEGAIYGKIVQKVGNRKYLENWSTDVAKIAQRQINWIKTKLQDKNDPISIEFKKFILSLQHNINSGIDESQAAEMLSQHLITKPIFEALFDQYSFVSQNPVSQAMETIVKELEHAGFSKEQEKLEPLYESVRMRAEGVEKSEDKQKIIVTLYNKFFKTAFEETTKRLGIVFTPIEVVDFIIRSVDDILNRHFNKSLSSQNVHILDPFTGTGTFIVRTLAYLKGQMDIGRINLADITRKFTQELHANEIVLLSYYIAAINIEATFDDINGEEQGYVPFEGIVLTDTFASGEVESTLDDDYFGINDERLKRQQEVPITVIISNPPYSSGQESENDNNQGLHYPKLERAIQETYMKESNANAKNTLFDTYIEAIRWSSDRLTDRGVIGFVTNGSFIDSRGADGLRKTLYNEFNYLYIFNLRGDQRTQGETSRKEGGKIFGSGSRTPIAISILVKDGSKQHEIYYNDIGDYLSREDKLNVLRKNQSVDNMEWQNIKPDNNNDWINQRDVNYAKYHALAGSDNSVLSDVMPGIQTARDSWVINYDKEKVEVNSKKLVNNYNQELDRLSIYSGKEKLEYINNDETFIKWTTSLKNKLVKNQKASIDDSDLMITMYRPFTKKWIMYSKDIVHRPSSWKRLYKQDDDVIFTTGIGISRPFSALMMKYVPNYHTLDTGKGYIFDKKYDLDSLVKIPEVLFNFGLDQGDVKYYVYAVLNSKEYQSRYQKNLGKEIPRIPILKNKEQYVEIGKKLADLHLNYENQQSWKDVSVEKKTENPSYKVTKMKHPHRGELSTIVYNKDITIRNIPEKAYRYIVNGRPAIDWIIDQYQIKVDNKSKIVDDPNKFSVDSKYILRLLLSIITVSMKTLQIMDEFPKFELDE